MLGIILAPFGKIPGAYPSEIAYSYGGNGTYLCPDDPFYNTRGEVGFYHDTQLGGMPIQSEVLSPNRLFIPNQPGIKGLGFFGRMRARRVAKALRGLGGLGSVPSDFELAPTYGWVPMIDGWVQAREGFQVGSWVPPNGWNAAGQYGPPMGSAQYAYPGPLGGLRDAVTADGSTIVVPAPVVAPSPNDPVAQAAAAAAQSIQDTLQAQNDRMFKLTILSTSVVAISALIATLRTFKQLKRDEHLFERQQARLNS